MHINQMPDDCLCLVIEELAKNVSLCELLQKSFVCDKWLGCVEKILRPWKKTSLKLFESERNYTPYRQYVLENCQLAQADPSYELHASESTRPTVNWKEEDHLLLRRFTGVSLDVISTVLRICFSHVTSLVISTFDIDQVETLRAFPNLVSLALVELPESRRIQGDMWRYLADGLPTLRHFHIFHAESYEPLNVEQLRPVLARLETFTLDRYRHDNLLELLACLSPAACSRLCLGKFGGYSKGAKFRAYLTQHGLPHLARVLVIHDTNFPMRRQAAVRAPVPPAPQQRQQLNPLGPNDEPPNVGGLLQEAVNLRVDVQEQLLNGLLNRVANLPHVRVPGRNNVNNNNNNNNHMHAVRARAVRARAARRIQFAPRGEMINLDDDDEDEDDERHPIQLLHQQFDNQMGEIEVEAQLEENEVAVEEALADNIHFVPFEPLFGKSPSPPPKPHSNLSLSLSHCIN